MVRSPPASQRDQLTPRSPRRVFLRDLHREMFGEAEGEQRVVHQVVSATNVAHMRLDVDSRGHSEVVSRADIRFLRARTRCSKKTACRDWGRDVSEWSSRPVPHRHGGKDAKVFKRGTFS